MSRHIFYAKRGVDFKKQRFNSNTHPRFKVEEYHKHKTRGKIFFDNSNKSKKKLPSMKSLLRKKKLNLILA